MSFLYVGEAEKETVSEAAQRAAAELALLSPDARINITVDRGAFGMFSITRFPDERTTEGPLD